MNRLSSESGPRRGDRASPSSGLRRLLVLGGAAAGVAAAWNLAPLALRLLPHRFEFTPVDDPAGFRRLAGGEASGGANPLTGISGARAPGDAPAIAPEILRADLCGALFRGADSGGATPVASFSDYRCPFCRILTRRLSAIEAASGGAVRIAWHEWPLLGPVSEVAAKAALAAKRQGAYPAFHEALMRGAFIPTPAFLQALAERIGVDPQRMLADMESAEVAREIAETRALAALFGFFGTPSMVVGRTLVTGEIGDAALRALIAREAEDGPVPACA